MGKGRYFAQDPDGKLRLFGQPEPKEGSAAFLINTKKLRVALERKPLLPPKKEQTSCLDCFKFWLENKNESPQSDGDDDNEHYYRSIRL
ncbi:MAG: hypothetical protein WAW86_05580 [Gammaproteobacteria bacterium]